MNHRKRRRAGGDRRYLLSKHPETVAAIAPWNPMAPLKWSSKSPKKMQEKLGLMGYKASLSAISEMLREQRGIYCKR